MPRPCQMPIISWHGVQPMLPPGVLVGSQDSDFHQSCNPPYEWFLKGFPPCDGNDSRGWHLWHLITAGLRRAAVGGKANPTNERAWVVVARPKIVRLHGHGQGTWVWRLAASAFFLPQSRLGCRRCRCRRRVCASMGGPACGVACLPPSPAQAKPSARPSEERKCVGKFVRGLRCWGGQISRRRDCRNAGGMGARSLPVRRRRAAIVWSQPF